MIFSKKKIEIILRINQKKNTKTEKKEKRKEKRKKKKKKKKPDQENQQLDESTQKPDSIVCDQHVQLVCVLVHLELIINILVHVVLVILVNCCFKEKISFLNK